MTRCKLQAARWYKLQATTDKLQATSCKIHQVEIHLVGAAVGSDGGVVGVLSEAGGGEVRGEGRQQAVAIESTCNS